MRDMDNQYRIIIGPAGERGRVGGAGWRPRTDRGRLRFSGRDRIAFLQALITNDIASLQPGQGVYAAYLTPQGRMVTDLRLHVRGDHVMADVPASLAARLATQFDLLIFSEDVQVADMSATVTQLSVCGAAAAEVLAAALGELFVEADVDASAAALRGLPVGAQIDAGPGFVARTDDATVESFDVFLPTGGVGQKAAAGTGVADAGPLDALARALAAHGAIAISEELAEALRIEAGRPAFTVDMTEDTIPLEAGLLERSISTTKGCYPGQEVVIRVLHRGGGRVAKRLVRLVFDAGAFDRDPSALIEHDQHATSAPPAGTPLLVEGRETGRITSAAWSPASQRVIALGYVHRDAAEIGRTVDVGAPPIATAIIDGFAS